MPSMTYSSFRFRKPELLANLSINLLKRSASTGFHVRNGLLDFGDRFFFHWLHRRAGPHLLLE